MATFLQLCKDTHRILRVGDAPPGTAPTTVVAQSNELGDIVYFVNKAWQMLQGHHPLWRWMTDSVTIDLTNGVRIYTVVNFQFQNSRFEQIMPFVAQSRQRYASIRDGSSVNNPSMFCYYIPWQEYNGYYTRNPVPSNQRPIYFSEADNRSVWVYPTPGLAPSGDVWKFGIPCRKTPQTLAIDADIPEMPAEFHDILTWWAADLFCRTRSNMGALSAESKIEVNRQLDKLAADQLPEMTVWNRYV